MSDYKFMTHKQLGIPKKWYDALLLVHGAMERGEFHHTPRSKLSDTAPTRGFKGAFNMSEWSSGGYNCGTVCCIGGSAEILGKTDIRCDLAERIHPDLYQLFFPNAIHNYDHITVRQAHLALLSYLQNGKPNWGCILEKSK